MITLQANHKVTEHKVEAILKALREKPFLGSQIRLVKGYYKSDIKSYEEIH